ncbi:MAG: PAS domain-containing sensor histidine kinase [Hoeflea sp.]|uniref:sensor histidine kinase NtrY-like n=1 Tax=Hoeflea sp. TaxID=1940281 RepID=UPI001E173A22|nr:PAS domain-containing sensor histidine kinase [Hoeflea sp.]MBU4529458.1 PAS domain-containing sensor histidine kinase [Alphaproteobacteria bacterium]MBU4546577.1 PAS domain-containing sensor histidine kinase [Alphaproteobacteria bacterium]MBU4550845.1 PAS domain-containing sensor histidine kinase [Alphaproteobacteria bacterium]MBV1723787.1 PAS domain-containing sensor histidine kinase [Hoeflea sp.]MBV1763064.1 PAS domain-containing sensor histidine kinase [Hoeflea sp.]
MAIDTAPGQADTDPALTEPADAGQEARQRRNLFTLPGIALVVTAFLSALISFSILLGLTPIEPVDQVVLAAVVINLIFVIGLVTLVLLEIRTLLKARRRGKAAARLHIRIVGLFSIVAILPAILIAIVASITLDVGLDRWFSLRTKAIVNSSLSVAQAYVLENARFLQGQTLSMANDLDNARSLYTLDRIGFEQFMTRQAIGRGLLGAFLVREDGSVILQADIQTERPLPAVPQQALDDAVKGQPTLIPPGVTNLVGALIPLQQISGALLYTVRVVDQEVMRSMRLMEEATEEYQTLEQGRTSLQLAFGILYLGFALVVLLSAIWTAIAVADRLVRPIRVLIGASDDVANGNLDVAVPVHASDGDVGSLAQTFNNMIVQIRTQRDQILSAKDQIDDRRRFTEAVLSGVSAGVVGVDHHGAVTIANRSAREILSHSGTDVIGRPFSEIAPEFETVMAEAAMRPRADARAQITLNRGGKERTLNVKVTREETHDQLESFVVTLDDITDLVIAQRSTAWADVARRIAHEIKNPLTPIQLSAERIRRRYGKQIPDDDRAVFDQCTDTIVRQVEDIGRMVDEFSSFARMPKPSKVRADLRDILKDAAFLREVSRNDIEFTREMPEEPLEGEFDPRMLGQAFGNLIKNATEAIDAVPADDERAGKTIIVRAGRSADGREYIIDIIDNGRGLPGENRHRLLEPYMTMRDKGTGLGLAIVKKIIDDHGGTIQLRDAPAEVDGGKGAMITVRLPVEASTHAGDDEKAKEPADGV